MVHVVGRSHVHLKTVDFRNLIAKGSVESMEIRFCFLISSKTEHRHQGIVSLKTRVRSVGVSQNLDRRKGICVIYCERIVVVLVIGNGTGEVHGKSQSLEQIRVKTRRVVESVASDVGIKTFRF